MRFLPMLRRYIFIQLKADYAEGLQFVRLVKAAEIALAAAYGVQEVLIEQGADDRTRDDWDLVITLRFVSNVDEARSLSDPITKAFIDSFLGERARRVWTGNFESTDRGGLSDPVQHKRRRHQL